MAYILQRMRGKSASREGGYHRAIDVALPSLGKRCLFRFYSYSMTMIMTAADELRLDGISFTAEEI